MKPPFTSAFLERYRVERKLAEGGMGMLYRGMHLGLEKAVAIKTLRPELAPNATAQERFLAEARLTARLSHPNVVRAIDQGRDGPLLFIVYEFVEGEDLRARLDREGKLVPEEFLRIALAVARAIEHAHAAGIAHRDLKPENILLGKAGEVQVSDFGLARSLDDTGLRTASGVILGTLHYLSPEAALGKRAERPADIYALGLMAFEMLAGRRMFEAETAVALLRMHTDEAARSLRAARSDAPAALEELVARSLEKDPRRRPTASAWVLGLEKLMAEGGWQASRSSPQATMALRQQDRPRAETVAKRVTGAGGALKSEMATRARAPKAPAPESRKPWVFGAIAASCIAAATVAFMLRGPKPEPPPVPAVHAMPAAPPRQAPPAVQPAPKRTLPGLIAFLQGPGSPNFGRIRLAMRSLISVLGDPMAPGSRGVDARTQQAEIERLSAELKAAVGWEPVGGLAPLLEEAAALLDQPAEREDAKLLFLETLQPLLDLEAYMLQRGLASRSPYHDFLYGMGKTRRRSFLYETRREAELDALVAKLPPSADDTASTTSWQGLESSSLQISGIESRGVHFAIWFLKMMGEDALPRLLPAECAGREDTPTQEACLNTPWENAISMHWAPAPGARLELWARAIDLKRTMSLGVKLAGYVHPVFRLHPSAWQESPPAAIVFTMPAPKLDVAPTIVPMVLELNLLPGEDVFARSQPIDQVSMTPVGLVLRLAGP